MPAPISPTAVLASHRALTPRQAGARDRDAASPCYPAVSRWKDDRLVEQVQAARADKLPIVMAHENDPEKGGVPFSRFFETTPQESDSLRGAATPPCPMPSTSPSTAPQELIAGNLYKDLAKSCYPGRHHEALGGGSALRVPFPPPNAPRCRSLPLRRCRSCSWQRASARLRSGRRWTSAIGRASSAAPLAACLSGRSATAATSARHRRGNPSSCTIDTSQSTRLRYALARVRAPGAGLSEKV